MLNIYPTEKYDSYISLIDAETLISSNVIDTTSWDALDDSVKELYLKQSTLLIKLKITDPREDETPSDLSLATALLSNYSVGKDMTNSDSNGNLKVKNITGVIEKEWFSPSKASNSFPDLVASLLSQYGYVSGNSFKLERS